MRIISRTAITEIGMHKAGDIVKNIILFISDVVLAKKQYITGAHGSGSARQKAKYREQRANRKHK